MNCSILAISSLTIENPPRRITFWVMIPEQQAREAVSALHLCEPVGKCGCVVDEEARPLREPCHDLGVH